MRESSLPLRPHNPSGNFLYIALQALKDLEREAIIWGSQTVRTSLQYSEIGPEAVKGIEINPYAAEIAQDTHRGADHTAEPVKGDQHVRVAGAGDGHPVRRALDQPADIPHSAASLIVALVRGVDQQHVGRAPAQCDFDDLPTLALPQVDDTASWWHRWLPPTGVDEFPYRSRPSLGRVHPPRGISSTLQKREFLHPSYEGKCLCRGFAAKHR